MYNRIPSQARIDASTEKFSSILHVVCPEAIMIIKKVHPVPFFDAVF